MNLWRQLVRAGGTGALLDAQQGRQDREEAASGTHYLYAGVRRGSKGKGLNHLGARPAYPVEYFAVLERHKDFERTVFTGICYSKELTQFPYKEVIQPLWMSATHYEPSTEESEGQGAKIAYIERIRNARAIGYVTKYLMKSVASVSGG